MEGSFAVGGGRAAPRWAEGSSVVDGGQLRGVGRGQFVLLDVRAHLGTEPWEGQGTGTVAETLDGRAGRLSISNASKAFSN